MPVSNDEGVDVFFDSLDYSSYEDSLNVNSEPVFGKFNYEIWREEPRSIHERRQRFLDGMGLDEFERSQLGYSQGIDEGMCGSSPKLLGSERIAESSGVVLRSCPCSENGRNGDSYWSLVDPYGGKNSVVCEPVRNCSSNALGEASNRLVTMQEFGTSVGPCSVQKLMQREVSSKGKNQEEGLNVRKKKWKSWWKSFIINRHGGGFCKRDVSDPKAHVPKERRMRVQHRQKRFIEFSALYVGQEIQAHKGFIWTMKFSPDGKFLASGGEDGVVRIWRVTEAEFSCKYPFAGCTPENFNQVKGGKSIYGRKNSKLASVVIPEKVFKIEETPLQEFHGHTGDILDLSWSKSNCLLSSSEDKTVRLWQVGCDKCLKVFHHNNYVTCIQFNPVNERYFISGSIDGKVRIWEISESRVVDWADVRDIITAICYRPDGQGCIVGSITGYCRVYDASGNHLELDAQLCVQGKKKSTCKRITGFQFAPEDSQRVMITSADSKVRIRDGFGVIHKYRGRRKSGSQMSASFTSNGRYIISVGEDSHVYVWSYDGLDVPSSNRAKSIRSSEHFFSEGATVAIPWSGMGHLETGSGNDSLHSSSEQTEQSESSFSWLRDSDRFSLGNWFFSDLRNAATWPEERLPLGPLPSAEDDHYHHHHQNFHSSLSATWGLIIVTAGLDGVIRSFHNYGLPVKL
ncbi:uncharacterized protein LOC143881899 [Tasmannia lanceolata]|uniref:uncharacterized protein LOC143881899 n=1 Tax=Tasmannia lanceolata TaxID=3420 RepID=UPI004063C9DA